MQCVKGKNKGLLIVIYIPYIKLELFDVFPFMSLLLCIFAFDPPPPSFCITFCMCHKTKAWTLEMILGPGTSYVPNKGKSHTQ